MTTREAEKAFSSAACTPDPWCDESPESVLPELRGRSKPALIGLPCARCSAYYDADLNACPICGCKERVSPTAGTTVVRPSLRAA